MATPTQEGALVPISILPDAPAQTRVYRKFKQNLFTLGCISMSYILSNQSQTLRDISRKYVANVSDFKNPDPYFTALTLGYIFYLAKSKKYFQVTIAVISYTVVIAALQTMRQE